MSGLLERYNVNTPPPICRRAEHPGSASYVQIDRSRLCSAQPGNQRHHFLHIERSADPTEFRLDTSVTSQQKAAHVHDRLQHRKRSLAEVLAVLATSLRFRTLHMFPMTASSGG